MQIKKPRSHSPKVYDNTEEDLILTPPSVLEGKLRRFEEHIKAREGLISNIGVALALLIAVLTADFKDFEKLSGQSIQGAFITGLFGMIILISYKGYRIYRTKGRSRKDVLQDLLGRQDVKKNKKEVHAHKKTE